MTEKNLGASVRSKLKNKAQAENKEFNLILTRYALERFLYRLSISEHRDHFLLKGALLFDYGSMFLSGRQEILIYWDFNCLMLPTC